MTESPEIIKKAMRETTEAPFGWEHEYYHDKEGGRTHCWFITYMDWNEYMHWARKSNERMTRISSVLLKPDEEES